MFSVYCCAAANSFEATVYVAVPLSVTMESSAPVMVCAGMMAAPLLLMAMLVASPVAVPTAPVVWLNDTVGFTLRRLLHC